MRKGKGYFLLSEAQKTMPRNLFPIPESYIKFATSIRNIELEYCDGDYVVWKFSAIRTSTHGVINL